MMLGSSLQRSPYSMFKICTNHDFSKQRLIVHDVGLHPSLLLCPPCRRCLPLHKVTVIAMIFGCCHCSLIYNVAIMRIVDCCPFFWRPWRWWLCLPRQFPNASSIDIQISALCRIGLTLHRNRMSRCAASCQGEDCHAEKWESQSTSFIHIFLLGWKSSYADNLREEVIENLLQNIQSRNQNRHPHAR